MGQHAIETLNSAPSNAHFQQCVKLSTHVKNQKTEFDDSVKSSYEVKISSASGTKSGKWKLFEVSFHKCDGEKIEGLTLVDYSLQGIEWDLAAQYILESGESFWITDRCGRKEGDSCLQQGARF